MTNSLIEWLKGCKIQLSTFMEYPNRDLMLFYSKGALRLKFSNLQNNKVSPICGNILTISRFFQQLSRKNITLEILLYQFLKPKTDTVKLKVHDDSNQGCNNV